MVRMFTEGYDLDPSRKETYTHNGIRVQFQQFNVSRPDIHRHAAVEQAKLVLAKALEEENVVQRLELLIIQEVPLKLKLLVRIAQTESLVDGVSDALKDERPLINSTQFTEQQKFTIL